MGGVSAKATEERLIWFKSFMPLYEKAAPLIRYITNLEKLQAGELPLSFHTLLESNLTLRPILDSVRRMHKPNEKQLAIIQREFEIALSNCIKAAESASKYVRLEEHSIDSRTLLSTIINSTVLAHEYIESVSKRLETPSMTILDAEPEPGLVPVEEHPKKGESPAKDVTQPPAALQLAINKAASGIEHGLNRLGDAMTLSMEKMAKYAERLKTINRKKRKRG